MPVGRMIVDKQIRGPRGLPGSGATAADVAVATYLTDPDAGAYDALHDAVDAAVEDAVEAHTPGIELDAIDRTSNFTTTSTALGGGSGLMTSFLVETVGTGRPVDLRFYAPSIYHSAASSGSPVYVTAVITATGGVLEPLNQYGSVRIESTSKGVSLNIQRRTPALDDGVTYTWGVYVAADVAGTTTLVAASYAPIQLSITSR